MIPDSITGQFVTYNLQFLELLARSAFRGDIEKSYASRLAMATDNSVYRSYLRRFSIRAARTT